MNKHWTYKKIGDVMIVERGGSPRPIEKYLTNDEDGFNWIKIGDATLSGKYIYETKEKITKEGLHKTRIVEVGDFILSNSMSFGRPYIMETRGCIHDGWLVLREKEKDLLNKDFLYYLLGSPYIFSQFDKLAAGSTVRNLNIGLVSSVEIPIPPLQEQQQIVTILDEAFAAIDQAKTKIEKNIANAKELFENSLQQIIKKKDKNWESKQLKDIALEFGRGKSKHRPRNWKGLFGGDYPFIQTGEIRNANKYVSEYSQTYNDVGLAQSKLWKKDTICITIAANIAETAILGFDACFPDSIIGLQVDPEKADLDFTYYLLQSFKAELQKLGKGSAQDNINLGTFENRHFPFPKTIEEQQKIVKQLDVLRTECQRLDSLFNSKLYSLDELKKSILQKAFAGELTTKMEVL
jgi:type I restriction enzyme S subunit